MTPFILAVLNTVTVAPATGDHSQTGLFIGIAAAAVAALAGTLFFTRKKK